MDKIYIKGLIQKVLDKEFKASGKRKILDHDGRYNFACPYCGDSKSEFKKRGNIYLDRLVYICFNCDKKTTFDKFCKDHHQEIDPSKKLEMIKHLDSVVDYSDYNDDFSDTKFDDLIELDDLSKLFNSNTTYYSDFEPIKVNGGIFKYLVGRGIDPGKHKNIYQAKHWKGEEEFEWVICMLNRKDNKVIGMQVRNLKEGKRRWFKIYNFENLYTWIHGEENDFDINKMVLYNKLSYFFNILNVDIHHKITVFEGYIDSLFYPNSLGLVGVGTDTRFIENNNLDIQYFYDNDDAGFRKSDQKIRIGIPVFLWNKLFNDIVDKKKTNDPYSLLYRISKVKDLNKLAQLIDKPYSKLKLYEFFSTDIYDLKWIPKIKKRKMIEVVDYNKKFNDFDKL